MAGRAWSWKTRGGGRLDADRDKGGLNLRGCLEENLGPGWTEELDVNRVMLRVHSRTRSGQKRHWRGPRPPRGPGASGLEGVGAEALQRMAAVPVRLLRADANVWSSLSSSAFALTIGASPWTISSDGLARPAASGWARALLQHD